MQTNTKYKWAMCIKQQYREMLERGSKAELSQHSTLRPKIKLGGPEGMQQLETLHPIISRFASFNRSSSCHHVPLLVHNAQPLFAFLIQPNVTMSQL